MYFNHTHHSSFLNGDYTYELDEETIKSILRMVASKIELRVIAQHFHIPLSVIIDLINHRYLS